MKDQFGGTADTVLKNGQRPVSATAVIRPPNPNGSSHYFEENFASLLPAEHVEGIYRCLDYYQTVSDPFSQALLRRYKTRFLGSAKFTAGSASTGLYRGLKLWEGAVHEAGTLEQAAVVRAIDHARIAEVPGGPVEMVPVSITCA